MSNVIYGQYNSNEYPLKRFYEYEIPHEIRTVLLMLNMKKMAIYRGGLAFVYLTNESQYLLKDLDMMAYSKSMDEILGCLECADIVYVNKNTFDDSVITAFWKANDDYYKLDILLCSYMPSLCEKNIDGKIFYLVSASYVWRNRIEKIAEKDIRKHDDKKTLNHFKVASKLSHYLVESNDVIDEKDLNVVKEKLSDVQEVLSKLIAEVELKQFMRLQLELVRR